MTLGAPIPVLRIFDEAKAREFYCGFLDFAVDWEHRFGEGFPLYMQLRRDACVLHLTGHHGDATPGSTIRIEVVDAAAFAAALRAKSYPYARPGAEAMPWGLLEASVQDPFSNRLTFYSAAPAEI